uniref:Cyclic nucleotide-binding/CBS domain-containing protein n=1 Tax=Thermodesulfovibrio aggregans TaxID=86166 RepID=A0A7C4AJJ4_9BACT
MVEVIEDTVEFLKGIPPFEFLSDEVLNSIAEKTSLEHYSKGTHILFQNGFPSEFLYIIKKGGVKVYRKADGEDIIIDYRSEGETFGFLSLISGDKSRANVIAVDETICYLVPKDTVINLINQYPEARDFFLKSYLNIYLDKAYKEETSKKILTTPVDKILFTTTIEEIASKNVISVPETTSIQEAANVMCDNNISSLIVINSQNIPVGIITDKDLRRKVVAPGKGVTESVKSIMTFPIIKVDARDYCFEAVFRMLKYNIHHLLVIKDGQIRGIITNHDIMLLQGVSPLTVVREIDIQQSTEGLIHVSKQLNSIIGHLLQQGAKASNITKIITEINDKIIRKIIQLAERELGPPPVPYCWIVLGAEGRKEQTFRTDQDNALIYSDPPQGQQESVRKYFLDFTNYIKENLVKCGFPPCPGNIMASNPRWCQPLKVWKKYFSDWIYTPKGDSIMFSNIFFDFRAVYGDFSLEETLRDYLLNIVKDQKIFLGYLANLAVKNRPPLGFFKTFVVEKSGEHKDKLNIKIKGIAPIVDIVRLFSLEKAVRETPTLERIDSLKNKHGVVKDLSEELIYAFEFLMLLRIRHQYSQVMEGLMPHNFINPESLSNLEKKMLKESFHLISKLQDLLIEKYKLLII